MDLWPASQVRVTTFSFGFLLILSLGQICELWLILAGNIRNSQKMSFRHKFLRKLQFPNQPKKFYEHFIISFLAIFFKPEHRKVACEIKMFLKFCFGFRLNKKTKPNSNHAFLSNQTEKVYEYNFQSQTFMQNILRIKFKTYKQNRTIMSKEISYKQLNNLTQKCCLTIWKIRHLVRITLVVLSNCYRELYYHSKFASESHIFKSFLTQ